MAIDVHAHVHSSVHDRPGEHPTDALFEYFGSEIVHPTVPDLATYYRERHMACVAFMVDASAATGMAPPGDQRGDRRAGRRARRRGHPVRVDRPALGGGRCAAGPGPGRAPRDPWLQVPPERAGLLPQRPRPLPPLPGHRRDRGTGRVPQRPHRRRCRPARRWGRPAQVLEPDVRRRRGGRLPRDADRPRPPVLSVAGRGDLGRPAQAERVHRPVRVVAQVLPGQPRPVLEHAAQGAGAVRLRLPGDHARTAGWPTSSGSTSSPRCDR